MLMAVFRLHNIINQGYKLKLTMTYQRKIAILFNSGKLQPQNVNFEPILRGLRNDTFSQV